MLKDVKLSLLDMDGTIYLDDDLFDGTLDFLEYVKSIGIYGLENTYAKAFIFLNNVKGKIDGDKIIYQDEKK